MPDPTLYLFDGLNLLRGGPFEEEGQLVDALASFVATAGARGVVVFDGSGEDTRRGPLEVRYAPEADPVVERLAAESRARERVLVVSSDATLLDTVGPDVGHLSAAAFFRELAPATGPAEPPRGLTGRLDDETRARLERLRRGE
jgi:predicted RNA-binding protein with PIN domain